ncbi:MAG: hypothetical protein HQL33_07390, partial [Alphaproteobacteria bacterium]|nr:hypothetical protein [Alphaproteobacteria bacterium]
MSRVFVARSAKLSKWGADVGVGNHLYKVGCADQSPDSLIKDGWAGETDWKLLASEEAEGAGEDEVIASIARREKMIDPALYPKIKGATGI